MLVCDDILFIHVPKTAGLSVTRWLIDNVSGRKLLTAPDGTARPRWGTRVASGIRHENLEEASRGLVRIGRSLDQFRVIMAVIRNPYDLEVSRYCFHRFGFSENQSLRKLARASDFDQWAREVPFPWGHRAVPVESFYTIDGTIPANMRLVRFEHLAQDLAEAIAPTPVRRPLKHVNASAHGHWSEYVSASNEPWIYQKYRWLFQFYPRADVGTGSSDGEHVVAAEAEALGEAGELVEQAAVGGVD
jgi:hypothetical protein